MKKLHGMILRGLPGPFVAAFGTLVFLLLLQFLIVNLSRLVGRGLPTGVILELVTYSLAYMVTLAVPMSALLAVLLVFGRLAETQAYAVAKASGISLLRLSWPVLVVGLGLVGGMLYFNNVMLPEANHRMRALWQDIRSSRPGFELEPGVFYDGLQGYAIRVEDTSADDGALAGVLIFDHSEGGREATIVAERGELVALPDGHTLQMTLDHGEVHRTSSVRGPAGREDRYERIAFDRHRLSLDLSDLAFERRDVESTTRTDRTMRTSQMVQLVDSLDAVGASRRADLRLRLAHLLRPQSASEPLSELASSRSPAGPALGVPTPDVPVATDSLTGPIRPPAAFEGLPEPDQASAYGLALQRTRAARAEVDAVVSNMQWEQRRATRYRIEIYKKYSMAAACLVFVVVAIPLGLAVRRRGYGWALVAAVAVFLFYWMMLVQGEKLSDRGFFPAWAGMWSANVIGALGASLLFWLEARNPAGLPWHRRGRTKER